MSLRAPDRDHTSCSIRPSRQAKTFRGQQKLCCQSQSLRQHRVMFSKQVVIALSMQAQLSELQKKLYKGRVEQYTGVSNLSDSNGPTRNITKDHKQRSQRRKHLKTSLTYSNSAKNEKYIKNFSKKTLSDDKVKLLSRDFKSIPTPPVPSSNKSLLKDFNNFARTMRLTYMFADINKTTSHPFHVKSSWQPSVQNSVALEKYLEETKLELDSVVFRPQNDNISANERKAIFSLKCNSEIK